MYAAWPVNLVHRYWLCRPISYITPFAFDPTRVSVHEHVYNLFGLVSWLFIFWAIWLYITGNYRQDRDFKTIFAAHFINLIIDVPHYLLVYQQSELICFIQGMIVVAASIWTLRRYIKKTSK